MDFYRSDDDFWRALGARVDRPEMGIKTCLFYMEGIEGG